jgi:glycosyltransferase involved in cell wall biosynthesis
MRETIKDGSNGFLVESEPEAIAKGMARLLDDEALARHMGERACVYVQEEWNVEKSVDRLEEHLLKVLGLSHTQVKAKCFAH